MEVKELVVGMEAPDFTLMGSDRDVHALHDYRGRKVILYFYPKDNTPGCTTQAQAFRDAFNDFKDLNAEIIGISRDTLTSHEKFIAKHELPFLLLADTEEIVCQLYGVLKEKNMYGKKSIGIERSTFVINEEGIIEQIFRKVKVAHHICELTDVLK